MLSELSEGALMAVTCNIAESSILQVLAIFPVSLTKSRMFVSDGATYMCADIETNLLQEIKRLSLIKTVLIFQGVGVPLKIKQIQDLGINNGRFIGNPIPFSQYIKSGFGPPIKSSNESVPVEKIQDIPTQPLLYVIESSNSNLEQTQKQIGFNEQNDKPLERCELQEASNTIPFEKTLKNQLENYLPIDMLYEGLRGWKILVRVIWVQSKKISNYKSKSRQPVEVLNFIVLDSQQNRAQCSAFQQSAEKWKAIIKKGSVYEFSNAKVMTSHKTSEILIRFQCQAVVTQIPNSQSKVNTIPKHFYKLTLINNLQSDCEQVEIDVAGIIKKILTKEAAPKNRYKVKLVLADPTVGKQIDVLLNLSSESVELLKQGIIVVMTNLKVFKSQDGTLSLKSGFKTDIITSFDKTDEEVQQFLPFLSSISRTQLTSLSHGYYKTRTLKSHMQALEISPYLQKIYSKINLWVLFPPDSNKTYYDACSKCSRKINKVATTTRRSNYCQNYMCRKIVETKKQYCLHILFTDWTHQIKLSLFKDSAKKLMGTSIDEFVLMGEQEQKVHLQKIKFKQLSVCIFSNNNLGEYKHEVSSIDEPHCQNLVLINQILEAANPFRVKKEAEQ